MTEYLRYQLENLEPLRVSDDSTSQSGQTSTLKYIPGSAVRGAMIAELVRERNLESIKKFLFSDRVRFLNAYISENCRELIPSVKGFYEDKTRGAGKKKIENVVTNGSFTDGFKRASLGEYCYIDGDTINYYRVPTGSDLKIKINLENTSEKKNVFRNEHVTPGLLFTGYIAVDTDDPHVRELICDSLKEHIIIGNARSSGLGKCRVIKKEFVGFERTPFAGYMPEHDAEGICYMALYSPLTMRNPIGEYCGIDTLELGRLLGVENLRIEHCSTSTVTVRGYNRTLGIKIPSVPMYQQGSVFKLVFDGTLTTEAMKHVMETGIGVRRNEGFGQVMFLDGYENVQYKSEGNRVAVVPVSDEPVPDNDPTLRIAAANYYRRLLSQGLQQKIVDGMKKGSLNNSQIGNVEALLISTRYNPDEARSVLEAYFKNAIEKEEKQNTHKDRDSVKPLRDYILGILDKPFGDAVGITSKSVMGFPVSELLTENDETLLKIQYLTEVIRHDNRKGGDA